MLISSYPSITSIQYEAKLSFGHVCQLKKLSDLSANTKRHGLCSKCQCAACLSTVWFGSSFQRKELNWRDLQCGSVNKSIALNIHHSLWNTLISTQKSTNIGLFLYLSIFYSKISSEIDMFIPVILIHKVKLLLCDFHRVDYD